MLFRLTGLKQFIFPHSLQKINNMTIQELNRDIKRLSKYIKDLSKAADIATDYTAYFKDIEVVAKPEFIRLYHAADDFSKISKDSVLTLLRLNLSHRFIQFHQFGNKIEL